MEVNKETIAMMKEALMVVIHEAMLQKEESGYPLHAEVELEDNLMAFSSSIESTFKINGAMKIGFFSMFGDIAREYEHYKVHGFYSKERSAYVIDVEAEGDRYYTFAIRPHGIVKID